MVKSVIVGYVVTTLIALLGLLMIGAPQVMIDFKVWNEKTILDAKFVPGQRTAQRTRLLGVFLILIDALVAYRIMTSP